MHGQGSGGLGGPGEPICNGKGMGVQGTGSGETSCRDLDPVFRRESGGLGDHHAGIGTLYSGGGSGGLGSRRMGSGGLGDQGLLHLIFEKGTKVPSVCKTFCNMMLAAQLKYHISYTRSEFKSLVHTCLLVEVCM